MSSPFERSDFVDTDYQAARKAAFSAGNATDPASTAHRPPTRDELDSKVTDAQQRLAELKAAQETLEREKASLEEARRRQAEFHTGREEMVTHLTRGLGLLEQAEFAARRDAEQLTKTLGELRLALEKLQGIQPDAWTRENWSTELTRALTTIENARLEWNSARLKWPVLTGEAVAANAPTNPKTNTSLNSLLAADNFSQLCRVGFALTWPVLVGALGIIVVLLLRK